MNYLFSGSVYIDANAQIGAGLRIIHAFGIAIGPVTIGRDCIIRHNVTIGGNNKKKANGQTVPVIGDHVRFSPGAVILGPVSIGSNVIIGANAVVLKNFPGDCVIAGVPAKIIGKYDFERFG